MRVEGAPYAIDRVIQQPNWDTIDMVKHDGHLYSSKPPLLPTLMAAVYWPIYRFGGVSLGTHPYEIGRSMLVLFNLIPLAIYFVLLAALVERFGTTDWGRIFVMAAACFGTFLTTFVVVINNHLPAAVCAVAAVYAAVRIWFDGERRLRYFIVAGLFGGLAAANELPALSLLAAIGVVLLWKAPKPTLLVFTPAVLVVAAAFFGTNWIAHHSLKPAYMHQGGADNWYDYTYRAQRPDDRELLEEPARASTRGEPSEKVYALNFFVGHHGIFSLTPVWLLSLVGHGPVDVPPRRRPRALVHGGDLRHLGGGRGVLSDPAAAAPQLRRLDQRPAVAVLARPALAAWSCCRRPISWPRAVGPAAWRWSCWPSPSSRSAIRPGIPGRIPG